MKSDSLLTQAIEHHKARQHPRAISLYRQFLQKNPNHPQALNNLAVALMDCEQFDQALAIAKNLTALHPKYPDAHNTLGNILRSQNASQSIASFQTAITLKSDYHQAWNNLGIAHLSLAQIDQAAAAFSRALEINPNFPQALSNLGMALKEQDRADEALAAFHKALDLDPALLSAHLNLGLFYYERGDLDRSLTWFQKALDLEPDNPIVLTGIANTEKDRGNVDQSLKYFRQALALAELHPTLNSNVLYTLHFHPDYDSQKILDAHRDWNNRLAAPLKPTESPKPQPLANRRIRVGYVSSDLRGHVVGRHLLPLLANHDRMQFEIFCYTDVRKPDAFTDQLRQYTDHWIDILGYSDAQLAEKIRTDKIDILVDLTLHMAGSRLLAFARKPAPVQLTWLGYCSTTGLSAMDYRLSDPNLDPPGSEKFYVEKTIRLPRTWWCYQLKGVPPDVSPLPAQSAGHVTFGCLNNFAKVSPPAQNLWARLLAAVPNSHLLLHCRAGSHRDALLNRFAAQNVSPDRIQFFIGGSWDLFMQQHHHIDIALDPFPYGGGITTMDALYMGVPIVTLAGQTAVGRGGASIVRNLNMPELIAQTPDQYIQIATNLAADLPRLTDLRKILRDRVQNSPLTDAKSFTTDFESIYRDLIQKQFE